MTDDVLVHNERTNQWIRRMVVLLAVLVLVLGGVTAASTGWLAMRSLDAAEAAKAQSEANADLLRIIVTVTGCDVDDVPEACEAALAEQSRKEGALRLAEVDCIVRRLAAGLPPVVPPRSCAIQTPPDIYPGVAP